MLNLEIKLNKCQKNLQFLEKKEFNFKSKYNLMNFIKVLIENQRTKIK